jgi:hypothetical protein
VKHLLKSEKSTAITLPGCDKAQSLNKLKHIANVLFSKFYSANFQNSIPLHSLHKWRHLLRLWYSVAIDERMSTDHCWDDPESQYWERKPSGFAAVPTAVDTWACLGLRLGCLHEKPPTVHLSQGNWHLL